MNNYQIHHYLASDPWASQFFGGVYPIDKVPMNFEWAYVVNTSPSTLQIGHWVAMCGDEFFCSFGTDPRFYGLPGMPHNTRQLQSFNSDVCGLYVIMYIQLRSRGYSMNDIVCTFTSNPNINDRIVTAAFNAGRWPA